MTNVEITKEAAVKLIGNDEKTCATTRQPNRQNFHTITAMG